MLQVVIYANEIEDRLLAPFYIAKQKAKKYELKLGDIAADITNGIDLRDFSGDGTLYFRISDIKRGQMNLLTAKRVRSDIDEMPEKILVHRGDLLMSRKGTPGISTLATEFEERGIIGTEIIKITLRNNVDITPEFLFTFLNHKFGFTQVLSKLTGTVSRGINHPALKSIRIPKINPLEQKFITEKIRGVLQKHVLAISKIEEAKKLLEEALDINHQKINEDRSYSVNFGDLTDILTPKFYYPKYLNTLKALKKKFKTIKLGEIADIKRGDEVGSKNYRKYVDRNDSDVPFIRTSDLVNYEVDNYPDYYIDEEIYKELKQDLKPDDLLVSNDGKIGFLAVLTSEDKCIIQSHVRRVRFRKETNPFYVLTFLATDFGQYQFQQYSFTQATIPTMSDRLGEVEIPIIKTDLQNKISQLVEEAFRLKTEKKRLFREALTKVEELLKSGILN